MRADVLLVTVTDVESRAVMDVFREACQREPTPLRVGDRVYHELGNINGAQVVMALSEMGSGGISASQQTVDKGIDALRPSAVILVGLAFGVNEATQVIGEVLVSQRLLLYELQRVGAQRVVPRGDRPHASGLLTDHLRSANLYWSGARVRFGLVLTGEKLVDNVDYREELRGFEPEAIGGEMEGAGLYVACVDAKVDWVVVKAICDWADGRKHEDKDRRQALAARNAASFVLHALQCIPFMRGRDIERDGDDSRTTVDTGRSTLPSQPYFVGREQELRTLAEAIHPGARTWGALIDGPGGIGKTALAIRAAHLAPVSDFPLKIFLSAKGRELTPAGERPLQDFRLPSFPAVLTELAMQLGEEGVARLDVGDRAKAVNRALAERRALLVLDNVESLQESERVRLYQFLSRLPTSCKAIVTSRRRDDIDARVVRLDRLHRQEALDLLTELASENRHLQRASESELQAIYDNTNGNPLLIKWMVGQLGRRGSRCRTISAACEFLRSAPPKNDPLEYVFGDLVDALSESEAAVVAALAHFSEPAKVEWVAELTGLAPSAAMTALEDLADRALLLKDEGARTFLLPPLAATFLRRKQPSAIARTGERLADRVFALALENGDRNYERFPVLETAWSEIAAALPLFLSGGNERLQRIILALNRFLEFSGRWDERLLLNRRAEDRALASGDLHNAGWRAFGGAWTHVLRRQGEQVLAAADRCEAHWTKAQAAGLTGARETALVLRLRGLAHQHENNYPAALAAFSECLALLRTVEEENEDVAVALDDLGSITRLMGDFMASERNYREAIRIGKGLGAQSQIAESIGNLAELYLSRTDWVSAEGLAREALSQAEALGRQENVGLNCLRLAMARWRQGDGGEETRSLARRAVALLTRLRAPDEPVARMLLGEVEGLHRAPSQTDPHHAG